MRDKTFLLQCAYCQGETKIIIKLPSTSTRGRKKGKKIQIIRNCEQCNRANILTVPETWEERQPVLGGEGSFLGYTNGIPIIRGEQHHDPTETGETSAQL
jgi:hypothetical protein